MHCKICQKEFKPNKYHPQQQVCFQSDCQRARQIQNMQEWRLKNPDYFRSLGQDEAWRKFQHSYNKLWKVTHKEYLKEYETSHKPQRREYMRQYMKRYREKAKSVNREKS